MAHIPSPTHTKKTLIFQSCFFYYYYFFFFLAFHNSEDPRFINVCDIDLLTSFVSLFVGAFGGVEASDCFMEHFAAVCAPAGVIYRAGLDYIFS